MPDDRLPAPEPNPSSVPWDEYEQLEAAVHDYLDHEPPNDLSRDLW